MSMALGGGKWQASRPRHFTSGKGTPSTHWAGGCVVHRDGLDAEKKRKILFLPGIEHRHSNPCPIAIPTGLLRPYYKIITHSLMELSPSGEAANSPATQEIPCILWNPKVHYRLPKSPPLVLNPEPAQTNPYHTILSL
jgi:hypothetical protein